jgi:hypothetical protein
MQGLGAARLFAGGGLLVHNQTEAALPGQSGPEPLNKDADTKARLGKKGDGMN